MRNVFIALSPESAWLPLMTFAGLLVIIGFRKLGLGIFCSVLLVALRRPFVEAFFHSLAPHELLLVILLGIGAAFLMTVYRYRHDIIPMLLYDLICLPFRMLGWIFRGSRR